LETKLPGGAAQARFVNVHLTPGPARVEALLAVGGQDRGPHYIDVRAQ